MELIKNKFYFNNDDGELFEFTTNNLNAKKIISQTQTLKKSSLSKENDHVSFINKNGIYETEENKQTKINTVLNTEINYTSIKYYANVSDYEVLVNKNIIYYSQPNKKLKPVTIPLPFSVTTSYQISSNLIEVGTSTGFVGSPYFSAISI